jgi:Ca2+-transporting ATPase
MFISTLCGMPVPLLPIHILWVNLVTDSLPALALGVDPVDRKIMNRAPRHPAERVVDAGRAFQILGQGFVIACCSLLAFSYIYYFEGRHAVSELFGALVALDYGRLADIFTVPEAMRVVLLGKARTVGFIVLAFCQDFQSYNCRSQTESLFRIGIFTNRKLIGATVVSLILNTCAIFVPFFQTVLKTQPLTGFELLVVLFSASIPFWAMEAYKLAKRLRR